MIYSPAKGALQTEHKRHPFPAPRGSGAPMHIRTQVNERPLWQLAGTDRPAWRLLGAHSCGQGGGGGLSPMPAGSAKVQGTQTAS